MVPKFRIFISSPSDVDRERQRAQRVIERLNGEFAHVAQLEAVRWETKFYSAHKTFQAEIPEAAACDVVISIFWTRIGSALPDSFARMPPRWPGDEGRSYPSGSAYETLTAIAARTTADRPDVYVFRKSAPPLVEVDKPADILERQDQWNRLEAFFQEWFRGKDGSFLAAYHSFVTADDFELAVERLLRDWIIAHVPGAASIVWPIATLGSPFRGLAAFDAKHSPVYFGRDLRINSAIDRLKAVGEGDDAGDQGRGIGEGRSRKPFLLIVGPSGSGKSSLARAGVAPRLTTPGVVSSVDLWRVAVMRPSDRANPFQALADALHVRGGDDDSGGFGKALPELVHGAVPTPHGLASLLAKGEPGAVDPVVAALDQAAADEAARGGFARPLRANLLLIVDQLEEIFGAGISDESRTTFANVLSQLAATQRIWIVATLRGDLYQRLIANPPFLALKDAGATCDLAPPGPEELEEIVRKSAAAAGLTYETDPQSGVRLDDTLLADAGSHGVLPLLQFTLDQLFAARTERDGKVFLTVEAYRRMGGLDGAIDQAAEAAIKQLGPAEIAALPRLLRLLAVPLHDNTVGQLALTVRPTPVGAATATPAMQRLVHALLASRVLLTFGGEGDGIVRVAHQRVFESWLRARAIVESQRDFYRIREEIEQQHARWLHGARSRALLIPPGRALAEAEEIVANYGDDLRPDLRDFVAASGRRARLRQTLSGMAAVTFAIVAAVAMLAGFEASRAQRSAEANYFTARGTVDSMIEIIAGRLRESQGVSPEAVDTALRSISEVVDELGKSAAKNDPTFDATRARMLYEFAKTFQRSAQDKALKVAEESLSYRRELDRRLPNRPDLLSDLADSLEQVGDLRRFKPADRPQVRELFEEAKSIRLAQFAKEPDNDKWAKSVSNILVRLGDLDALDNRWHEAIAQYQKALTISIDVHLRRPGDPVRLRELSWGFNKIGIALLAKSPLHDPAEALKNFEKALCIRRHLADRQKGVRLPQSDVSWTLDLIGRAKRELKDLDGADVAFLEAWLLRQVSGSERSATRLLEDLYLIQSRLADHRLTREQWRSAYAFYQEAEATMRLFKSLKGNEASLLQRRKADAIVREPEPHFKALAWLSAAEAEAIQSEPEVVLLPERIKIEKELPRLRAGAATCLAELTDTLKRTAEEKQAIE